MAELDGLCGLDKVKADVKSLINLVKVRKLRQEHELPIPPMSLHLVFLGNPGTGKTTVARLLAKIYHAIGVLSKGQLVEVDRSGLVAGFVGQTAIKTGEVIQKALGGVLFIDEAYALANQDAPNDFGKEAIETLLKGMEDHRADLIVIVAGYTELMGTFIHANPGLESRFNKYFYFEDYNGGQLMAIFQSMCAKNGYTLSDEAEEYAGTYFRELYEERDENFGNARDVRNVFERAVSRQSDRVAALEAPGKEDLMSLTLADLREDDGAQTEGT
ncbi:AAA family ATPase [Lawsonibacter hominis]|uniref:AAA family ATPase n=2 Tax=Lawsonibacter TaxID=2172004 RepID=UPI00332FED94